ncbi:MAG: hypothetical protein WC855_02130 [Thermodesulfovibrionales bacterium]
MQKIVLGMVMFALASFVMSSNNAYALMVNVENKYKTPVEVNISKSTVSIRAMADINVDVWKPADIWWKASIPTNKSNRNDDFIGDSNAINQILIKFTAENTVTLIDPQIPLTKVGQFPAHVANNIYITVQPNGDIDVSWEWREIMDNIVGNPNLILVRKSFKRDEKIGGYFPDPDNVGALRSKNEDWITLQTLKSDLAGGATGSAKVTNKSKSFKVQLRGVDEFGNVKNAEWWLPNETKRFDFRSAFGKKVQCRQVWLAPKCRKNDNACNSSRDEKTTPAGWGKWEQSCPNIEFVEILNSGGGAPDRLGLR